MTKGEFKNEYERLARGHGREEAVTDERLHAMFEVLVAYDVTDLRHAVTQCLRLERMPSFEKLHAACEYAAELAKSRRRQRDREGVTQVMDGLLPRLPGVADLEGLRLHRDLCMAAWDRNLPPGVVADELERFTEEFPWLREEVTALRGMGDHWRNVNGHPTDAELAAQAIR